MTYYLPTEIYSIPLEHYAREKELVAMGWERGRSFRIEKGYAVPFYKERPRILNPEGWISVCWDVIHAEYHSAP